MEKRKRGRCDGCSSGRAVLASGEYADFIRGEFSLSVEPLLAGNSGGQAPAMEKGTHAAWLLNPGVSSQDICLRARSMGVG